MPKKFISQEIIDKMTDEKKKSRILIRNPEKRELFKDIINSNFLKRKGNENRITAFNRLWTKAQRISRIVKGKDINISQRSNFAANLVRENTYYRSSFLDNFRYSKKVKLDDAIFDAEFKTYFERTKSFREKYENEIVNGEIITGFKNLTLKDYFEMFKNKQIDKDTMNEIIDFFKTDTAYYKGQIGSD